MVDPKLIYFVVVENTSAVIIVAVVNQRFVEVNYTEPHPNKIRRSLRTIDYRVHGPLPSKTIFSIVFSKRRMVRYV